MSLKSRISSSDLIEEFFEREKYNYPELSLQNIKDICYSPWTFLAKNMESGELPKVRFKYFGTFQVYKGRAENMLHNLSKRFKMHKIDPKEYFRLKLMLENFLNKIENE